jgi:putative DNA primase/helicase
VPDISPARRGKHNPRVASALGIQTDERTNKMICNTLNAQVMLRNMVGNESVAIFYDDFLDKKVVRWGDETLRPWADTDNIKLQVILQHKGLFTLQSYSAKDAANAVANENHTNCVCDYLNSLKWDGERRLTMFLPRAFGTPTERYYLRAGRNWIISLIARAFEPGCQVSTATILEGTQGIYKSTALRVLGQPWYYELVANPDHKDFEQQLRGVWLGEFPELHSLQKAAIERVKQFITNPDDRYRPSYKSEEVSHLRRCVLVGTTNRSDWARDDTGNIRFIPIRCTYVDLKWLKANRDQIFAEAVYAYRHGRKWWWWPKKEMLEEQAERAPADMWTEQITANWKDAARKDGTRDYVTVSRILADVVGIQTAAQNNTHAARVANVLRKLGFEYASRRRIDGARCYPWYAPAEIPLDVPVDPLLN